jgi:hypothetical protein
MAEAVTLHAQSKEVSLSSLYYVNVLTESL